MDWDRWQGRATAAKTTAAGQMLTAAGYVPWLDAGNCSAWRKDIEGGYLLITDGECDMAEHESTSEITWWWVQRRHDGDDTGERDQCCCFPGLARAIAWAAADDAFSTMSLAALDRWYAYNVGHSPLQDAPEQWTEETLREVCREYAAAGVDLTALTELEARVRLV